MPVKIAVMEAVETGLPYVKIPAGELWNFVEYLSYRRAKVAYGYHSSHFTATFLHCDRQAVQALLDDWTALVPPEAPAAGSYAHSQT